jgi:hypothetical protein
MLSYANGLERLAEDARRAAVRAAADRREAAIVIGQGILREQRRMGSLGTFLHADPNVAARFAGDLAETGKRLLARVLPQADADRFAAAGFLMPADDRRVPSRNPAVKGPLDPGGDWVVEKAGAAAANIAIARLPNSGDVTYEIVNFVDGRRSVSEIRDAVSAEFEPVALKDVAEYLDLLARAGAITFKP